MADPGSPSEIARLDAGQLPDGTEGCGIHHALVLRLGGGRGSFRDRGSRGEISLYAERAGQARFSTLTS